jgi:hypothetical protein
MSVDCPWGTLSAGALTQEQIFWLADTISSKKCTAAALAKQLGLKPRMLYKLANNKKHKKVMQSATGRARALDSTALSQLKRMVTGSAAATITRGQILDALAQEYQASASRRRQDPSSLKPLSARSLKRYLDQLLALKEQATAPNASLADLPTADDPLPILC